jgi:hypothetical protein
MRFDIPDGFVVVPLNATGAPTGIALWCATPEQCEEVFNQEHGGEGNAYLMACWRSSEASKTGQVPPPARPKPPAPNVPQPNPKAIKVKARHRVED